MKKIVTGILLTIMIIFISKNYAFEEKIDRNTSPIFAYYVDGVKTTEIPSKEMDYTLSSDSKCNNGVTITWNNDTYSAIVDYSNFNLEGVSRTSCELHFKKISSLRSVAYNDTNGMWEYKKSISKIIIQNKIEEIEGSIKTTDESSMGDESIMSYVVPNEDGETYTAYLQSNGELRLNADSSYLFLSFSKVSELEGMEYVDTSNVTKMYDMFSYMSSLTSLDLSSFDTSSVTDMRDMFIGTKSLISLDVSNFDTSSVTYMDGMFKNMSSLESLDLSGFNTSNVTSMSYIFSQMRSLKSLNISHFDTSKITNMYGMFSWMNSLESLDLSSFDTSNVTEMGEMFSETSSLTSLDLSNFDTSNVTDMNYMFSGMSSITSLDISSFNTSKATSMWGMFYKMSSLTSLDLSNFDTSNVTNMQEMFSQMSSLTSLDLSNFDTSNVADMNSMFLDNSKLSAITYGDKFIRKSDSSITDMFYNCPANKPTHSSWDGAF